MVDFQDNAMLNEEVFSKLIPQEKIEEITAHTNDTLVMMLNSLGIKATRQEDGNFLLTVKEHNQNKQVRKEIFEEIKGLQTQQDKADPDKLERIGAMITAGIDNLLNNLDKLNPLSPTEAFAGDLDFIEEELKKDQEEIQKLDNEIELLKEEKKRTEEEKKRTEEEKKRTEEEKKRIKILLQKVKEIYKIVENIDNRTNGNKVNINNQDYLELQNGKKYIIDNKDILIKDMKNNGMEWKEYENSLNDIVSSIDKILSTYKK